MKRVLLDANLVVLLVVGNVGRERIASHKRLSAYRAEDWDLLVNELAPYGQIVFTPNILSEASNFLRSGDKKLQKQFATMFARLTLDNHEHYLPSKDVVVHPEFADLGLTDTACLQIEDQEITLLTADAGLYVAAMRQGLPATNFNHLRDV